MKTPTAYVESEMLQWARTSAGMSIEDAARALQTREEKIVAWEEGGSSPSMSQLRRMAKAYRRQLSDFYLPTPPVEPPLPHDFRRQPGQIAQVYSKELRFELRSAMERRQIALDLFEELGLEVPLLKATIKRKDAPDDVGRKIRELLGVNFGSQNRWREPRIHYREWRSKIESLGVLVFQVATVSTVQMLGFSMADRPMPVIAINRKLAPNGRTFTMLHEFVHVLLGENSLCDLDEDAIRPPQENSTEVFCNAVAAATLMPEKEFVNHDVVQKHGDGKEDWDDAELGKLVRSFGASEEAVLRRLLSFSLTTRAFYLRRRAILQARNKQLESSKDEGEEFARNMPREAVSNLGRPFTRLVLDTYADARLSLSDVSRYLGLRGSQVSKVREMVEA